MSEALSTAPTSSLEQDYERLRDDCGIVGLADVALIELTGEDRKGWLQGQATNDLRNFDAGASRSFCICEATGQILTVCDCWSLPDRFLLTCPRSTVEALLTRVRAMVIMEDVSAEDVSDRFSLVSVQGPAATSALTGLVSLPNLDAGESEFEGTQVRSCRSDRTGLGGWDVWIPTGQAKALKKLTKLFPSIGEETYDVARLEAGIPRYGRDITIKTLPPELGSAFEAKHVSYSKGCYTGQEVLMRIRSRGHTNRTWIGLLAEKPLASGALVSHQARAEVGLVSSAGFSPDYGYMGAAMLRNEVARERETVTVSTPSGTVEAEVRSMPILRFD